MDTRIKDISTVGMAAAVSKVKGLKADKAENAFSSLFDSVVKSSSGKENTDDLKQLSAGSKSSESGYYVQTGRDTESVAATKSVSQKETQDTPVLDQTGQTDMEKAEAVVNEICDKLGLSKEELLENFNELLESVMSLLMEKFGVTEEEINQVLENLGLSLVDMFQTTDLMNTLVAVSGADNLAAILTDEDLYVQVQEVVQEVTGLQENFADTDQLSAEELKQLQESLNTISQADVAVDETEAVPNTNAVAETADTELPVLEVVTDKAESQADSQHNSSQQEHNVLTGQEGFAQFAGRVAEFAEQAVGTDNAFASQVDMEEVIQQIMDHVKLQVQSDTTSLEMQLHPESYGKLNLHVSVREGVVTAQMAVENEMVKSALESQVVQLKDEMAEKGLKVDAVEVTIASHEFERNLDEGRQEEKNSEEAAHTARRQINLQNDAMSLDEIMEMSEAESLTRKIMLENGNSIDFSA